MPDFIKKASKTIGLAPGSVVYVGEKKFEKPRISIIDYDQKNFMEKQARDAGECFPFKESPTITWINIDGLYDTDMISQIGSYFDIHHLILEDIVNTSQRPKFEEFGKYIFIVLKMLHFDEKEDETKAEQVSIILGDNFVISFQEEEGDVFDPVRTRIREDKGRVRKSGADYLAYVLVDAVVDNYFMVLEKLGEKIADIEDELVANPSTEKLRLIQDLKRDMIFLRKSVWPLREIISGLQRTESDLIREHTAVYMRDLYDHTIQIIDTIESLRDMVSGMLDIYMSSISNKMNEVMKVLTIIATIFIPITFVAGIYGMNFDPNASKLNMPELAWPFGYIFAWGVMISIITGMVVYFKKKRWI